MTEGEQVEYGPVLKNFSKEQLVERAKEFMRIECGPPRNLDPEARMQWHERLGLLMLYVDHVWGNN